MLNTLRRRWGITPAWLVVLAAVVLVATTVDVLNRGAFTSFDHDVSRQLLDLHVKDHRWLKRCVYVLTLFGQRGTVLVLTVPTVLYLAWRSRSADPLVRYAIALIALTLLVYAAKDAVGRTAPPVDLLHTASGESYPSGHLANAVVTWWLVWSLARGVDASMILTRVLGVVRIVGPICVVVGMSLLDYHWQSDFVAGACVGIVLLSLATHRWVGVVTAALDRRLWSARSSA